MSWCSPGKKPTHLPSRLGRKSSSTDRAEEMEHKLTIDPRELEEYDVGINKWEDAFWRDMGIARVNHDIFFRLLPAQYPTDPYKKKSAVRLARRVKWDRPVTRVSPCAKPTP